MNAWTKPRKPVLFCHACHLAQADLDHCANCTRSLIPQRSPYCTYCQRVTAPGRCSACNEIFPESFREEYRNAINIWLYKMMNFESNEARRLAEAERASQEERQRREELLKTFHTYADVARLADEYGILGKQTDSEEEKVRRHSKKIDWNNIDHGNLVRIAMATEEQNRLLERLARKLSKVVGLLETVLQPVAAQVKERERLDHEAEDSLPVKESRNGHP